MITMRKVCIASSKSSFNQQQGSRKTPHASHLETEAKHCLRGNQRRAARAAWVRCGLSTLWRDPKMDDLARSSRRCAQPFPLSHCCSKNNRAFLPGPLWNSIRKREHMFRGSRQVSEKSELFKKPEPDAQFQCKRTSSIDQQSQSTWGSEAKSTTKSRYIYIRGREKVFGLIKVGLGPCGIRGQQVFRLSVYVDLRLWDLIKARIGITRLLPPHRIFRQGSAQVSQYFRESVVLQIRHT